MGPDAQTLKLVIDCVGYSLTGLMGLYGAWKRMRMVVGTHRSRSGQRRRRPSKTMELERLEKVERDLADLRNRQIEIHQETMSQQNAMLKQQSASLELLMQQRNILDKILVRMSGLA